MDVLSRWVEVVQRPEGEVRLDQAALLLSAAADPALDVDAQLGRLDDLAGQVGPDGTAGLFRLLFVDLGLVGDRQSYDDPLNSYIDKVLDRRCGIPISLSVLAIEIGRRCHIRLEAVGMPGHFLLRDPAEPDRLIDAFDSGRRIGRAECARLLQATTGPTSRLTPEMLAPVGPHAVLARMLANLDGSFERRGDIASLAWVTDLRLALPHAPLGDRAQLAGRLSAVGRFDDAATVLEGMAASVDSASARNSLIEKAHSLRARLN